MTTIRSHSIEPHLFVVLGATSDLMRRKLPPALYQLRVGEAVPGSLIVLGVSRQTGLTNNNFRDLAREALGASKPPGEPTIPWCSECLFFQGIGAGRPEDFQALADRIKALEQEHHLPGNRVFYLALPPSRSKASALTCESPSCQLLLTPTSPPSLVNSV